MIALCFLQHPINFDALDGQPVTTLFTVISPTVKSHLHVLSDWLSCSGTRDSEPPCNASPRRIQLADALACAEATIPAPRGPRWVDDHARVIAGRPEGHRSCRSF